MKVYNIRFETNAPMNADINSGPLQLYEMFGYSIQIEWTGSPTGAFKLQASSDPIYKNAQVQPVPVNWTDIADSTVTVSTSGNYMWNVFDVMYNYVRLVYTDGSGGVSNAILTQAEFNGKGV